MGHRFEYEILEDRVLLSAGELDSSFGQSGYVNLPNLQGSWNSFAPLPSGDFVVVGEKTNKSGHNDGLLVARYTSDWKLDAAFGTGGVAEFPLNTPYGIHLIVRLDGELLIGGDFAGVRETLRLTSNGSLDQTFGKSGFVKNFVIQGIQSDDAMIGTDGNLLQRRTPRAGLLDPTFGADGSFNLLADTGDTRLYAALVIKIQADDRIVIAEELAGMNYGDDDGLIIFRLLRSGELDQSFDNTGSYRDSQESFDALDVGANGEIVVAADDFRTGGQILEFTPTGEIVHSLTPGYLDANQIMVAPNGDFEILANGEFGQFLPDGTPDLRFDDGRFYNFQDSTPSAGMVQTNMGEILLVGSAFFPPDPTADYAIVPSLFRVTTKDDGLPIERFSHSQIVAIYGTAGSNHIAVTRTASSLTFSMDGISKTFLTSHVDTIQVYAGAGNDVIDIDGGHTKITIDGGDGNDHINIRSGDIASITGDGGDDFIDGSGVNPKTSGGIYADGGPGDDHIIGSPHDDFLEGGNGNDTIDGNGGSGDGIYGDGGDDVLLHTNFQTRGGTGNDTLYGVGRGDIGDDTYYIRDGQPETIHDYSGNNRAQIDDSKTVQDTLRGNFVIIP